MRPFALCVVASLFAAHGIAQDAAPSPILVVTAGKSWSASGKPLPRGRTLSPGTQLNQARPELLDLILDCGKAGWLSYSCGKVPCTIEACQTSAKGVKIARVDLSAGNESSSGSSGTNWFSSLFKREPATLSVLGVRAGGHMTDAIVQATESEVHLGPALNRVLEGKYCFRFTPLPPGDASAPKQAILDWDRATDAEGVIRLPGMQPGLYTVEKSGSDAAGACDFEPDATPAWVLMASSSGYPGLEMQWKDLTARMRDMERDGASPTVLLTVRHAALAYLADTAQRNK